MFNIYIFLKNQSVALKIKDSLIEIFNDLEILCNIKTEYPPSKKCNSAYDIVIVEDSIYSDEKVCLLKAQSILLTSNTYICDNPDYASFKIIYLPLKIKHLSRLVLSIVNSNNNEFTIKEIKLKDDISSGSLYHIKHKDKICNLSSTETLITKLLFTHYPNSLSKEFLLKEVWGFNSDIETKTLESHIYNIRNKLLENNVPLSILKEPEGFGLKFI